MEKPKHLAIRGKVINIEKIGEKSQAQFAAQLKQNGIVLEPEHLDQLYKNLRGEMTEAQQQAKAEAEERAAQIKAEAEARTAEAKAKFNK